MRKIKNLPTEQKARKGGYALLETVIALTVIAIVFSAILITVERSVLSTQRDIRASRARITTESALACFTYGENLSEFQNELARLGYAFEEDDGYYLLDLSGGVCLTLTVDYSGEETDGRPVFVARATYGEQVLYDVTYRKAVNPRT